MKTDSLSFIALKIVLLIAVVVLLIVVGPILGIWALNTLFPILNIPYTIETWFASLILFGSISSRIKS